MAFPAAFRRSGRGELSVVQAGEIRERGKCSCGREFLRITGATGTMFKDGLRYIEPDRAESGWNVFRCQKCNSVIYDTWRAA